MARVRIPRWGFLVLAGCATLAPVDAGADWAVDGNPVCTATGDQAAIAAAPDGSGGAFVAWRDARRGPALIDLYGTRVLADGSIAAGWPANGLALAETGMAGVPYAIDDGAGGLLLVWFDTSTYQVRMQHVGGDGVPAAGFPPNGKVLPISVGGPGGYHLRAVGDGAGGAYVLWNGFNGSSDLVYVTRFTAAGDLASGWTAGGVVVGGDSFSMSPNYVQLTLATDPAGGALAGQINVQEDEPIGSSMIGHVKRALATGAAGFGAALYPSGHDGLPGSHHYVQAMSNTPDGSGGAFAAWRIGGPLGPALYMQRYLPTGSTSWPDPSPAPVMDAMFRDDSGGLFLLGRPLGLDRLELHRRAGDASIPPGWATGLLLSSSGSYSVFAGVRSGPRAYVCWSSGGAGEHDILASRVEPDGALAPGWTAGGTEVCGAGGQQELGAVVAGLGDDALLAWTDRRSGSSDVYVARLTPPGPAPVGVPGPGPSAGVALAAERLTPNPAREGAELSILLPTSDPATVEVLDPAGRVILRVEPQPVAGRQRVAIATSRLANGLYFARVRQGAASASLRFTVLH